MTEKRARDCANEIIAPTLRDLNSSAPSSPSALKNVGVGDVLVISLERSGRWPLASERLQRSGFDQTAFRKLQAIDGKRFANDSESLKTLTTPQMEWMTRYVNYGPGMWTIGALGCALSHICAWEYVAHNKRGIEAILVMEDDVLPIAHKERLPDRMAQLIVEAGGVDKFDFLRYDWWPSNEFGTRLESHSDRLWKEKGLIYFNTCCLVTRRGARKLLERAYPISLHIDNLISFVAGMDPSFVSLCVKDRQQYVVQDREIKSEIRSSDITGKRLAADAGHYSDQLAESSSTADDERVVYAVTIAVLATVAVMLLIIIIVLLSVWAARSSQTLSSKKKKTNLAEHVPVSTTTSSI